MSFLLSSLEPDDELRELLEKAKAVPIKEIYDLELYDVNIKIFYSDNITGDELIDVRAATDVEAYLSAIDAVILVDKNQTISMSKKDMVAIIASMLLRITPSFVGKMQKPVIVIEKNYYEMSPGIVSYFGKDVEYYHEFFEEIENPTPGHATYENNEPERKSSFEEALGIR